MIPLRQLAIISFTAAGKACSRELMKRLEEQGYQCAGYEMARTAAGRETKQSGTAEPLTAWPGSLQEWAGMHWHRETALIFIGAAGIAVRAIAPFVKDKMTDPAVLVMDEQALHVIPLLSGHIGGANELAAEIGRLSGARPVLTTATDLQERFAVDVFARRNQLYITDRVKAKEISARILDGAVIQVYTDGTPVGKWPDQLQQTARACQADIIISPWHEGPGLWLIPAAVVAGVGCRRGISGRQLEAFLEKCLQEQGLCRESLAAVASIDLKKAEPGLVALCDKWSLPLLTYSSEELGAASGEFAESAFVKAQTGVGNVCERAAVLAGGRQVLMPKRVGTGMTAALMIKDWRIYFT